MAAILKLIFKGQGLKIQPAVVEQKMNLAYSKYVSKPNYLLVLKMLLG
jgi:hypothetical protein